MKFPERAWRRFFGLGFDPLKVHLEHLPAQADYYNAQEGQVAFVGGIGCGKTHAASDDVLRVAAMYPRCGKGKNTPGIAICSNTYQQLVDGTMASFFERCEHWGLTWVDKIRSEHKVYIKEFDAWIGVYSVDEPDKFKSYEFCHIWVDEAQKWDKIAYDKLIGRHRGTTRQRKLYPKMPLRIRITANPPHTMDHWLVDLTTKPSETTGEIPCRLITASTYDNPYLPQGYIDRLLGTYDPELAEIEMGGKFGELGKGRVWRRFSRSRHLLTPAEALARGLPALKYDSSIPISWGHDFNIDPMCSVIFQWRYVNVAGYQEIVMYVLDIIRARTSIVDDVVREFCENKPEAFKIAKRWGLHLYGDASGRTQGNRQTGVSDWTALRAGLKSYGISGETYLPTDEDGKPGANPPLRDRFAAGNRMLENARGEVGCIINADTCGPLAVDAERMYYKPGTLLVDIPSQKDGEAKKLIGHLADAWSYPIHYRFPVVER